MPPGSADEISGDGNNSLSHLRYYEISIYGNKYSSVFHKRQNVVLIQQDQVENDGGGGSLKIF